MDYAKKVIDQMPLKELWNAQGPVQAVRESDILNTDEIKNILRTGPIKFAVADVVLQWISLDDCFEFWKTAKSNIANKDQFFLEDFPDGFAYVASKWKRDSGETIILLEKHH